MPIWREKGRGKIEESGRGKHPMSVTEEFLITGVCLVARSLAPETHYLSVAILAVGSQFDQTHLDELFAPN